MSVIAILQARVSSSRLPGKVLRPILGTPMLQHQIERVSRCKNIDQLVIATSDQESDDAIEALAKKLGIECYRGSLDDVLDRFYQAAVKRKPQHIVRLTGDCPLIDPQVIDKTIAHHLDTGADYTSNTSPPTYPDGLDVEVITFKALKQAWQEAKLTSEREHVTPYIRKQDALFHLENVVNDIDLSHLRWTVDELEDFNFVNEIYKRLHDIKPHFITEDVLDVIEGDQSLMDINKHFIRNEGYKVSLDKEKH